MRSFSQHLLRLFALLALLSFHTRAWSDVLLEHLQDSPYHFALSSADFLDHHELSTFVMNKITVPKGGWLVSKITLYGVGDTTSPANPAANLMLARTNDMTRFDGTIYTGVQAASQRYNGAKSQDLVFTFSTPLYLSAGTYCLTGYASRNQGDGGYWYQGLHSCLPANQAYYQNPWGGEKDSFGGTPVTLQKANLAFGSKNPPMTEGALQVVGTLPKGRILHVTPGGTGDGSSWSSALPDPLAAVKVAGVGDQIWVSQGNYLLPGGAWVGPGVQMYGGFVGNEPDTFDITKRDMVNHKTNVANNQGDGTVLGVWGPSTFPQDESQVIDGFYITGYGAGISANNCSPTLSNNNISFVQGNWSGGMSLNNCDRAIVTNSYFFQNKGVGDGGAIGVFNCSQQLAVNAVGWNGNPFLLPGFKPTQCVIANNTLYNNYGRNGGGIQGWYSHLLIQKNSLIQNRVTAAQNAGLGGAIDYDNCLATVDGNIFDSNWSFGGEGGAIVAGAWDEPYLGFSVIQNNTFLANGANKAADISQWGCSGVIQRNLFRKAYSNWILGIYLNNWDYNNYIDINNNVFDQNSIYDIFGTPQDNNSLIWSDGGVAGFTNNTFTGNTFGTLFQLQGENNLFNNIFANNTLKNNLITGDIVGISEGYNLLFNNGATTAFGDGTILTPSPSDLQTDPLLGDGNIPAGYSPVINAGDNTVVDPAWRDFTGGRRIAVGQVDIGAIEVQNPGVGTKLVLEKTIAELTDVAPLKATLTRLTDGGAVKGEKVDFYLGSTLIGSATTDAKGVALLLYAPPSAMLDGSYTITVRHEENLLFGRSKATNALVLKKITLVLKLSAAKGAVGETFNLNGTVTRKSNGKPYAYGIFYCYVDGVFVTIGFSDTTGAITALYTIEEPVTPGTHKLSMVFKSTTIHNPVSATSTLTVAQALTSITAPDVSGKVGDTVNLTAKVIRTTDKAGLKNRAVTFLIDGSAVGTTNTDDGGNATLPYAIAVTKGKHKLTASFAGDVYYKKSSINAVLTVN